MSNTIKLSNLSEPQVRAFTEILPALSASGLVTTTKSSIKIKYHPVVFDSPGKFSFRHLAGAIRTAAPKYTGNQNVLQNLFKKMEA